MSPYVIIFPIYKNGLNCYAFAVKASQHTEICRVSLGISYVLTLTCFTVCKRIKTMSVIISTTLIKARNVRPGSYIYTRMFL